MFYPHIPCLGEFYFLMVCNLPYGVYTDGVEAESMHGSVDEFASRVGLRAIRVGIAAGLFACLAYPLAAFAHLPKLATTTLVACFGPALGVASYGLRRLLDFETPRLSSALGLLLNALAGVLFSTMALVQLAVGYSAGGDKVAAPFIAIWLGLDVAWDAYIGLGTICFALLCCDIPASDESLRFSGWPSVPVYSRSI